MGTLLRNNLAEALRTLIDIIEEIDGHEGSDSHCKLCRSIVEAQKHLKKHDDDCNRAPLYFDGIAMHKDWLPPDGSKQITLDPAEARIVEVAVDALVRSRLGEEFLAKLPPEEQEAVLAPRRGEWRPAVSIIVRAAVAHLQVGSKH
jgi:hypothetical protein